MNARSVLALCGVLAVVCLILAIPFIEVSSGQQPVQPSIAPGRYQIVVKPIEQNSTVFVFDTHTGRVWWRQTGFSEEWTDLGSPVDRRPD